MEGQLFTDLVKRINTLPHGNVETGAFKLHATRPPVFGQIDPFANTSINNMILPC